VVGLKVGAVGAKVGLYVVGRNVGFAEVGKDVGRIGAKVGLGVA